MHFCVFVTVVTLCLVIFFLVKACMRSTECRLIFTCIYDFIVKATLNIAKENHICWKITT